MKLPQLKSRDLIALIRKAGFDHTHDKGGHSYYRNLSTGQSTCVPRHPGDVHRGLVKKILLVVCGLSRATIERLLHG